MMLVLAWVSVLSYQIIRSAQQASNRAWLVLFLKKDIDIALDNQACCSLRPASNIMTTSTSGILPIYLINFIAAGFEGLMQILGLTQRSKM